MTVTTERVENKTRPRFVRAMRGVGSTGSAWSQRFRRSDGAASASMLLLIPLLLLITELAIFGGRMAGARGEVASAARQAAREASLSSGPGTAQGRAQAVAAASLTNNTFNCNSPQVNVDTGDFVAGGRVEVEITCVVDFSDLSNLSVPGTHTITKSAAEPVDPFRVIE